jgi:uncharacterized membrane protein
VVIALLTGIAVAYSLPGQQGWAFRVVLGWDVGASALVALIWALILTSDAKTTHCRSASADPGRTFSWVLVSVACTLSVFAGAGVLRHARTIAPSAGSTLIALCLWAVVAAWTLVHTSFTLRYAHLYYRDNDDDAGGLVFPGGQRPDDLDFAYFAFTVGMCFQVSDVTVSSSQFRRTVLAHALLSFAYNTVIVAVALNLSLVALG